LRRGRETCGDLDLLATGPACAPEHTSAAVEYVAAYPGIHDISVSALWALAEQQTANQVLAAHEAAVATAFAFVDEHASFTRRGHNGVLQVDTDGLIAASFVHRTSRAADPQLHTHLRVANKVRAAGRQVAFARRARAVRDAEGRRMLYKAALRSELSTRLGVAWTPVDEKRCRGGRGRPASAHRAVVGAPSRAKGGGDELIASREVELDGRLLRTRRTECFQIAAYRTRTPKLDADTPTAELRAHWRTEADAWCLGPERWLGTSPTDLRARRTSPRRRSWRGHRPPRGAERDVGTRGSRRGGITVRQRDDRRGGPRVRGGSRREGGSPTRR